MDMKIISVLTTRATRSAAAILIAAAISISGAHSVDSAGDPVAASSTAAATWLAGRSEADGGVSSGFAPGSDVGTTADAVIALATAGRPTAAHLDYLAAQVRTNSKLTTGLMAKIALAVHAADSDPRAFAGVDLAEKLLAAYRSDTGVIGDSVFTHSLAMLALARVGSRVPEKAVTTLESLQAPSGGWAFAGGDKADVDTTAVAVQALIAVGRPAQRGSAGRGLGYLHSLQNSDGGFPYQVPSEFGTESNVNSTALVAQTIIAAGDQPESWAARHGNPLSFIVRMANDGGAFGFQKSFADDNVLATAGAIPALLRKPIGVR
jgi:hypothetical protein